MQRQTNDSTNATIKLRVNEDTHSASELKRTIMEKKKWTRIQGDSVKRCKYFTFYVLGCFASRISSFLFSSSILEHFSTVELFVRFVSFNSAQIHAFALSSVHSIQRSFPKIDSFHIRIYTINFPLSAFFGTLTYY